MKIPEGFEPIARDGKLILFADKERENGVLVNIRTKTVMSEIQWLQTFFKWGNFTKIEDEEFLDLSTKEFTTLPKSHIIQSHSLKSEAKRPSDQGGLE